MQVVSYPPNRHPAVNANSTKTGFQPLVRNNDFANHQVSPAHDVTINQLTGSKEGISPIIKKAGPGEETM